MLSSSKYKQSSLLDWVIKMRREMVLFVFTSVLSCSLYHAGSLWNRDKQMKEVQPVSEHHMFPLPLLEHPTFPPVLRIDSANAAER